jgi:hypothetical protein
MKSKTFFLAVLLLFATKFISQNQAPASGDSALSAIQAQVDTLKVKTKAAHDSLASVKTSLNQLAEGSYIADQDAIAKFNKNKDSIYQNSSYGLLACRKCGEAPKKNKGCINPNTIYAKITFWLALILLAFLWYKGIKLFRKSGMCKDPGALPDAERSYSYARVQLFWWTMIILTLYIYFFAFTGMLLPLNSTAVILLGAGIAVYSGGKVIDTRQQTSLGGAKPEHKTEGLLNDILSDENGVTIHRFQSVLFNLVFGVGYFLTFLKNVKFCLYPFPDFSEWQFALLGISSAAYLGLKTTEYTPQPGGSKPGATPGTPAEEPTVRDTQNLNQ